jgi:hypothetical protein
MQRRLYFLKTNVYEIRIRVTVGTPRNVEDVVHPIS